MIKYSMYVQFSTTHVLKFMLKILSIHNMQFVVVYEISAVNNIANNMLV